MCAFDLNQWRQRLKPSSHPAHDQAQEAIKASVLHYLNQQHNDTSFTIKVSEIECNDPACPGLETVILIMSEGEKSRAIKIQKAMMEVTTDEAVSALIEFLERKT